MRRENRKRLSIVILFFILFSPYPSLGEDLYEFRLDNGLKNTEPYSYVLIKKAHADQPHAKSILEEAAKYSPNLPAVYFELSKISFSLSPQGIFESLDYVIKGIAAYQRNFWWLLSIAGLLHLSLVFSFIMAIVIIISMRLPMEAPLIAHDIAEDRGKALMLVFLILLSLPGPIFFIAGALFLMGLYFSKIDKTIVYVSLLSLLLSPFLLRITNLFFSASSPELRAIVAVNEDKDNKYATSILKDKRDFASRFSYALALKREGDYREAIKVYKNLLSSAYGGTAPEVYVNLGNCYFATNNMEAAKDIYKKSLEIKPLPSALYNLSQVSRETFDFEKGEEYFLEAVKLSRESVSKFTSIVSRNPNRFVIDETLPMSVLWEYASSRSGEALNISLLHSNLTLVIPIVLIPLFYIINKRTKYTAYRCKRCNAILCEKCAKGFLHGQMCPRCYMSLVKLDELNSRDRAAKVLAVYEHQSRRKTISKVLSFTIPGIARIYSGRILTGMMFLWLFLFLLIVTVLNPFFSTGLLSFSHSWLTIPSVILMAILYLISNLSERRRLNRGWL